MRLVPLLLLAPAIVDAQTFDLTRTESYDDRRGYGFETSVPTAFSIRAAEGNYRVTVEFADAASARSARILAETRRLMIEPDSGPENATRSFIVNIRNRSLPPLPENAPGGTQVRLNPRELETFTWDDRLTLDFTGARPRSVTIERANVPTVYLAGDSTVTDQQAAPSASWGQMLPRFFKPDVAIANHAESGETLKSFMTGLRLDKILSTLQPGDWLLIQFGHNDQKAQWPQTYAEAATTYRDYLRAYIGEARRRGATPILITSPERRRFDDGGHIVNSHGDYPEAVRAVAREESVAVIDLWSASKQFYESLGPQRAPRAFADEGRDLTHHSDYGAYELARRVVEGMRAADARLTGHLAEQLETDGSPRARG
ncbi:rhamnogalacturonan acetylesterase [Povalibacter uvarum]|nr:rhamnogalacturonan acetylesterase [Povalibacter uvarum]